MSGNTQAACLAEEIQQHKTVILWNFVFALINKDIIKSTRRSTRFGLKKWKHTYKRFESRASITAYSYLTNHDIANLKRWTWNILK